MCIPNYDSWRSSSADSDFSTGLSKSGKRKTKDNIKSLLSRPDLVNSNKEEFIKQNLNKIVKKFPKKTPVPSFDPTFKLDDKFIADDKTFNTFKSAIDKHLMSCRDFDVNAFLRGNKATSPQVLATNQMFLENSIKFVGKKVNQISLEKNISLENAYKLFIGCLDKFEEFSQESQINRPQSTFILRSALLLSAQEACVNLQSWMAYTKKGKPDNKFIWPFLDNWKNWVPEAQGAMAKFAEITFIKAKELAKKHPDNQLILLKGGFGAGKTRLAGQLMKEQRAGVVAPDLGKRVVRRTMETFLHASAHIQGSQIAYKLFDDMIKQIVGTVVYDSSLSLPEDVESYIAKSKEAGKKVVIYDVARHDMARTLSVLKRDVGGDDPRIPPEFIISSAIRDKLNRANCMKLILEYKVQRGEETLAPEYHFIAGDKQGWDTEEVMFLTPHTVEKIHPEIYKRLELEGLEIDEVTNMIINKTSKEELETYYNSEFERFVIDIVQDLSESERATLISVFNKRVFNFDFSSGPIHDAVSFYEALPLKIKNVLTKESVLKAFNSIKVETRQTFFDSIHENSLSYLDLPLRVALIIHQNLAKDPWL